MVLTGFRWVVAERSRPLGSWGGGREMVGGSGAPCLEPHRPDYKRKGVEMVVVGARGGYEVRSERIDLVRSVQLKCIT